MMGLKAVYSLFCDCWGLYGKYATSKLGDEELQAFISESAAMSKKHHEDAFAREIILAVMNEIDKKAQIKEDLRR